MRLKKPATENERLFLSVLLTFIVYFGLNSLTALIFKEETTLFLGYNMTISFLVSMIAGVGFFIFTRPSPTEEKDAKKEEKNPIDKNFAILERALSADEMQLLRIIKDSEGITQDSLRFTTGFSKSKVSALITELEKNGIMHREEMGRTYRLFIAEWLKK